ncbi:MAG: hypothetical protein ACPGVO_13625 [Spirulinaceae cyanobacterium]
MMNIEAGLAVDLLYGLAGGVSGLLLYLLLTLRFEHRTQWSATHANPASPQEDPAN